MESHKRTIIASCRATFASISWSITFRVVIVAYSLTDQVHFDHDGYDTVALWFTERFDAETESLRNLTEDGTTK